MKLEVIHGQIAANLPFTFLSFYVNENQTYVGTIDEAGATFKVTKGNNIFEVSDSGVISFKNAPDYETDERAYEIMIISSKHTKYIVNINVRDVLSTFKLTSTTPLLIDTNF